VGCKTLTESINQDIIVHCVNMAKLITKLFFTI